MNILTFDLEEWYTYSKMKNNSKVYYLPILDKLLDDLLDILDAKKIQATFFCLGIIAVQHPEIIKRIHSRGHEIACHSHTHRWLTEFNHKGFALDTNQAINALEHIIGTKIKGYRAPAFSIGEHNKWALEVLKENGIEYDCSIFPAVRDFGGFPSFSEDKPCIISYDGIKIKEFPIGITNILGVDIAYSGGGYFRLLPFNKIRSIISQKEYVMTYFHLRDFDTKQKRNFSMRYFKNYYGISGAKKKLGLMLDTFSFINVNQAEKSMDWTRVPLIKL